MTDLRPLLQEQICQVDARVDGAAGVYAAERDEIRRAVAFVDELCGELGLGQFERILNPSTGKPQLLLLMRNAWGDRVVLKVYGRQRPNEAAVQRLWWQKGVATVRVLDSGDDPVSWLLMPYVPGIAPSLAECPALTADVACIMTAAHCIYQDSVGSPRDLYAGIGMHLRTVLGVAARHDYDVPTGVDLKAAEVMRSGAPTFLHGDLGPTNLLRTPSGLRILDICGYTGPAEFDAARWCARVGGSRSAETALARWLDVEAALDPDLADRLLGLELLMEAGVREIVKEERGLPWIQRDDETQRLLHIGAAMGVAS
jgi:Aminoglycoside/hydroxyurea antibiotic resistance kinase